MPATAMNAYLLRLRRVLTYIDENAEGDLSVERLSSVAAFSKYHFHRQFSACFGIGVHRFVQLVRLRRASYRLAFRSQPVIDIALASGYESHEAFTRAFKKMLGQTPSEFRAQPAWAPWHATYQPLSELRSLHMKPDHHDDDVRIVSFTATRVAALEHKGDPRRLGDSVRALIAWRKQQRLSPDVSATFNIFYDDPEQTPPEAFRCDLCVASDRAIPTNTLGVVEKTIPGGRCAVLRHVGSEDTLPHSIAYLYGRWLPTSGEQPRDFPLYLQRIRFFPEVSEQEAVTDIFLPLR